MISQIKCQSLQIVLPFSATICNLLLLLFCVGFSSCKESNTLGGNLLPKGDQSEYIASSKFNLTAFTVKEDYYKVQ